MGHEKKVLMLPTIGDASLVAAATDRKRDNLRSFLIMFFMMNLGFQPKNVYRLYT